MKQNFFYIPLNRRELLLGWLYLIFHIFALPGLVRAVCALLAPQWDLAERNIVCFILGFCATVGIFADFLRRTWDELPERLKGILWKAVLAAVLCKVVTTVMNDFFFFFLPEFFNLTDTGPVLLNPNDNLIHQFLTQHYGLMMLCTVFLVPVSEELLYRGTVFGSLYQVNPWLGWIVSALLFAVVHVAGYYGQVEPIYFLILFLQYIPASLFLNWLYVSTDSIFAPILMHILFNAMGFF